MSVRGVPEQDLPENQGEDTRYYIDPVTQQKVELDEKGNPTVEMGADGRPVSEREEREKAEKEKAEKDTAKRDEVAEKQNEVVKSQNEQSYGESAVNQEQLDREAQGNEDPPKPAAKRTAKKAASK